MEAVRNGVIGLLACLMCASMFWMAGCGGDDAPRPPAESGAPAVSDKNSSKASSGKQASAGDTSTKPPAAPAAGGDRLSGGPRLTPPQVADAGTSDATPAVPAVQRPPSAASGASESKPPVPVAPTQGGPSFPSLPPAAEETTPPSANSGAASAVSSAEELASRQLPADWPQPLFALVLTGEQHGYLEPCGCTAGQSGGVSRRADLVGKLEARKWDVAGLDLGATVRRNRRQSQLKFETTLAALRDMKYQAVALGPEELRLGPDYLLSQHVADPDNPEKSIGMLAANVVFFDVPDLGTPAHSRVFSVGGKKVGVTAIVGKSVQDSIFPEGSQTDVKFLDPSESLAAALEELKAEKPELLVLLSHAKLGESIALSEKFPDFQIVVSAGGPEDPDGKPRKVGGSWVMNVGKKGKHAGVLGVYPPDAEQRFRFSLVELEKDRFDDTPRMVEHMRFYQDRLRQEQLAGKEPAIRHPSGATFVGAEKCGECHTKAFAKWSTTGHAQAFESLKHPREGDPDYGITRIYDAECLSCHVTGWHPQEVFRYEGGFLNEEFAQNEMEKKLFQLLRGNQCENCHGPGSKHIELVEADQLDEARSLVRVTLETARKTLCFQCHDLDNDPHFEFDSYWEQIAHPGKD